jgi:hypothetical protein
MIYTLYEWRFIYLENFSQYFNQRDIFLDFNIRQSAAENSRFLPYFCVTLPSTSRESGRGDKLRLSAPPDIFPLFAYKPALFTFSQQQSGKNSERMSRDPVSLFPNMHLRVYRWVHTMFLDSKVRRRWGEKGFSPRRRRCCTAATTKSSAVQLGVCVFC